MSTDGRSNVNPTAAIGRQVTEITDEISRLRSQLLVHSTKTTEITTVSASVQAKIDLLNAELKVVSGNPKYPTL